MEALAMRSLFSLVLVSFGSLAACSDGSSSGSGNAGGGGSGGAATTTSDGGGGSGGTATTTSTTETTTTTTTDTTTTTTPTGTPVTGCESAGADPVLFGNDIQPIFSQSCGSSSGMATCHMKASPSEGLSLKPGQAYGALVGVNAKQSCNGQKRVEASSAAGSYLVNKITDTDICGNNKKMPLQGTLSAANKQKIIDWICQGAQNN
jgi:hypothetical protein